MSRRKTGRDVPIFPRLEQGNAAWLERMRAKYETKEANLVDRLISYCRKCKRIDSYLKKTA